jgi:hypothetical protein
MIRKRGYPALLPLAACSNVSIIGTLHMHGVSTGDDKRVQKTWVRRPCIVPGSLRALREPSAQHILPPACRRPAAGLPWGRQYASRAGRFRSHFHHQWQLLPRPWGCLGKSQEYRILECHSPLSEPCRYPIPQSRRFPWRPRGILADNLT